MANLPRNVLALIGEYSKPITRADWRDCKEEQSYEIWNELIENPVFNRLFHKEHNIQQYIYHGVIIREGQRFKGYLPTRWD